jgi:hypothetical protein
VLLKSYGEVASWKPVAAESRIIFYYGIRSIPKPWSFVKDELDEHFGYPVVAGIEEANEYFPVLWRKRHRIYGLRPEEMGHHRRTRTNTRFLINAPLREFMA